MTLYPPRQPRPPNRGGIARQATLSSVGEPQPLSLKDAILQTVAYADLFDYPLTADQIHRYLLGLAVAPTQVEAYLSSNGDLRDLLGNSPPFWFVAGRDHLVELRQERERYSRRLWRTARRYGRAIARLPFVRMVAVTGSLAMNNVSHRCDDIDLMIVAPRNRVWLARAFVILVVRLARLQRIELCPNYVLAQHHLVLDDVNLYTAHELAQLVPLSGFEVYQALLKSNAWLWEYLPNAVPHTRAELALGRAAVLGQRTLERVLDGRLGGALERWESERKIARLRGEAARCGSRGAAFTPDRCKGHLDDHGGRVRTHYAQRLQALGLQYRDPLTESSPDPALDEEAP